MGTNQAVEHCTSNPASIRDNKHAKNGNRFLFIYFFLAQDFQVLSGKVWLGDKPQTVVQKSTCVYQIGQKTKHKGKS